MRGEHAGDDTGRPDASATDDVEVAEERRPASDTAPGDRAAADVPLVSFVVATYNRRDDLAEVMESVLRQEYPRTEVVVVSNATDGTSRLFEDGARYDRPDVTYLDFDGRMGVPKARNVGFRAAEGDVLVTVDDDAVFADDDAARRIVETFEDHPDVGGIAFQSRDYYTDEVVRVELPDPPVGSDRGVDEPYPATFFVGVGNAIRRDALDAAGDYPESFVYGFEEMDLSLRLLDAGYDVRYEPSVRVRHKKTAAGREPDQDSLANELQNRVRIMIRNLPWRYVVVSTVVWCVATVVRSGGSLGPVRDALASVFAERETLLAERDVVDAGTVARLKAHGAIWGWLYGPHPRRFLEEGVGLDRLEW